jgi:predicted MFS family arabinose efflux permease
VVRRGSGPVTRLATLGFAAVLVLPPLAPSALGLTLALVAFGALNGALDVAMNAQAATVERGYGRPIMSSFHALFSAGGLAGAAVGGLVAGAGVAPTAHLVGAAVLVGAAAPYVSRPMLPGAADAHAPGPGGHALTRLTPRLLARGLLAFDVRFAAGAMAAWTAVYLRAVAGAGAALAAGGYAAFSVTMAAGRTVGDALTARFGGRRLVQAGGAIAAAGIALALGAPAPAFGIAGFGLVGAGLATVFPSVLAAASRVPGVASGAGIALVSTLGYTGFLAGPPLIGFVADAATLRGGLAVVGVAGVLIVALAGALRDPRDVAAAGPGAAAALPSEGAG